MRCVDRCMWWGVHACLVGSVRCMCVEGVCMHVEMSCRVGKLSACRRVYVPGRTLSGLYTCRKGIYVCLSIWIVHMPHACTVAQLNTRDFMAGVLKNTCLQAMFAGSALQA